MHKLGLSSQALEVIKKRRGQVRVFQELDLGRMALVIIDMQNCFVAPGGAIEVPLARGIISNINRLAEVCRAKAIPVFWVRHVNKPDGTDWHLFYNLFLGPAMKETVLSQLSEGSWGTETYKEMDVKEGDYQLEKCRYSALVPGSSKLERLLRAQGKDTIIITGTRTSVCCESTARDAMMMDFKVLFVIDANATFTDEEHQRTLDILAQGFVDPVSTDELIKQIKGK